MKFLLIVFLCWMSSIAYSQQPAYFMLGEDQFRGIQIYDVIQDKELNYWFATNEGLYWFNSVNYEKVECSHAKSNSVFNFVMNEAGTIFCHNLNNQVFVIKDKSCKLFYELSAEEGGADVSLSLADDGSVVIGSRQFIVLDLNGKVKQRYPISKHYIGPSFQTREKILQYHLSESDSVLSYSKGKFTLHRFKGLKNAQPHVLKFYKEGDHTYALDLSSKDRYIYDPATFALTAIKRDPLMLVDVALRLYETKSGLWIANSLPGVRYTGSSIINSGQNVFYNNYFISDVYQDVDGNILLSTFDKGVLVIPDLKVPDVINSFINDPVTSLYSDPVNGLILGSSKGMLMQYKNGQLSTISTSGKRPIEEIEGHKDGDWYIFDDGFIRAYNKLSGKTVDVILASLKDAVFVSPTVFYLGTNRGVAKVVESKPGIFQLDWIAELNSRTHFMDYDPSNKHLYISTATGLFVLKDNAQLISIKYKGEDLFPNGIHYAKGKVYISTKENGILVVSKGKIIREILPKVNGELQTLRKIQLHGNTFIAQSSNGFFQFDLNGNLIKSLHSIYGFSSKRVIDFTFHQGKLWVSHSGGVQQIDLNYNSSSPFKPQVRIDKILVNNRIIAKYGKSDFSSRESKFQFYFSSPTLRNRESIIYHYRLIGYEDKWTAGDYKTNQVTYNALAPGKYVFELKIEHQGMLSEVQSYSFTIASPIYLRWWFLVIAALIFIGIVYFIYRWQLKLQRIKSERINELNASKLTAIQSQMNPHFIFNSLNSIQDLILKGDVENSYSYITTFSNLVRRTLNYSEKDFIEFEQELKLLELYLSLEKLRFKKDFDYIIKYSGVEDIMLPPLLVQPFIENALVHGLLHKEGMKNLSITFRMEDVLICTIEDNGIGRKAASAIKKRQHIEHESFSGKAIHHRFEILSAVFDGEFGYYYEDLEENGQAKGTRVILKIPVKQKF